MKKILLVVFVFLIGITAHSQSSSWVVESVEPQTPNPFAISNVWKVFAHNDYLKISLENEEVHEHSASGWALSDNCAGPSYTGRILAYLRDGSHGKDYIAGNFESVNGTSGYAIVQKDVATGTITDISTTMFDTNDQIRTLYLDYPWLYMGGRFAAALPPFTGDSTFNVCRVNLVNNTWENVGNFHHDDYCYIDEVFDIDVSNGKMFATGRLFANGTVPGTIPSKPSAVLTTANTWDFTPSGSFNGVGFSADQYAGSLYVGGIIADSTQQNSSFILSVTETSCDAIAFAQWGSIYSVVGHGVDLFIGGTFTSVQTVSGIPQTTYANNIALYTPSLGWEPLGVGTINNTYPTNGITNMSVANGAAIYDMCILADTLYVGGRFNHAGPITSKHIARFVHTGVTTIHEEAFRNGNFTIYPNPAVDYLTVNANEPMEILISNMSGQIVKSESLRIGKNTILLDIPKGMYLLTTSVDSKTKKLVIQ